MVSSLNAWKIKYSQVDLLLYCYFLYPIFIIITSSFVSSSGILVVIGNIGILINFILLFKKKKLKIDCIILILTIILYFSIYSLSNGEYLTFYLSNQSGLLRIFGLHTGVFTYVIFRVISDPVRLKEILLKVAIISFIVYTIQAIEPLTNGYWIIDGIWAPYNMSYGYNVLFPVIIFIYYFFYTKKIQYMLFAVVGGFEILLLGSRGPFFGIAFFILIYALLMDYKYKGFKIFILLSVIIICYMLLQNPELFIKLSDFLKQNGLPSRTIRKIAEGILLDDTGRRTIREAIYDMFLNTRIIIGYGPLGDHILTGSYSHNLILEFLVSFGIILGPLLLIALFVSSIYVFLKKDNEWFAVYIIFLALSIPKLMISSSFWYEGTFWAMIAILVNMRSKIKT